MNGAALAATGLALALAAGAARADTLVGANGDRLSGHVLEPHDGRIVFESDLFGRLEVPADKARVETDAPVASTPASTAAAKPVEKSSPWSIDVGAKLNVDRGSLKTSEDKLDTSLVLVRRTDDFELHGIVKYQYKRTEGQLRDDDWLASLAQDRFLSERRFNAWRIMAASELTSEGYDKTLAISAATGWRLWETPEHFLRIGPALGYIDITRGGQNFNGPAVGLYARAMSPLFGDAQLTGELHVLDALGNGRYANVELRVRHPLGERLFIAVGWNYLWSDFDIESGIKSEWRWDIGWRFGPSEGK